MFFQILQKLFYLEGYKSLASPDQTLPYFLCLSHFESLFFHFLLDQNLNLFHQAKRASLQEIYIYLKKEKE